MASFPNQRRPVTVSEHELARRCALGRVVIIDDDAEILSALAALIEFYGYACETYASALAFLRVLDCNQPHFPGPVCVLCDVKMPELDGLGLQNRLAAWDDTPILLMSGKCGAEEAVSAFRAGALDFFIKPIDADVLMAAVGKALHASAERRGGRIRKDDLDNRVATLTAREREIARRVAEGQTNPDIADMLGIALRTVKLHRQRAMAKLGAYKTADLIRIADEADL